MKQNKHMQETRHKLISLAGMLRKLADRDAAAGEAIYLNDLLRKHRRACHNGRRCHKPSESACYGRFRRHQKARENHTVRVLLAAGKSMLFLLCESSALDLHKYEQAFRLIRSRATVQAETRPLQCALSARFDCCGGYGCAHFVFICKQG